MFAFKSAFDATVKLSSGCGCGCHETPDERASDPSIITSACASNRDASNPGTADPVRNARADMPDEISHEDLGAASSRTLSCARFFPMT